MCALSRRAYSERSTATSWQEIWEAGPFYDQVSECLEGAKEFAILVGWQIDSRLPMSRPFSTQLEMLKSKLIRLCNARPELQIYLLMWDHAYFYCVERESWQSRIWENIHPRIHFIFDNRHPFGGSHHEKICLIDGRIAFCGGIDFCDERWDSPHHLFYDSRRSLDWKKEHHGPYHDLAVKVTGPICKVIHQHIAERWRGICNIPFPEPPSDLSANPENSKGGHTVYLSRTSAPIEPSSKNRGVTREIEFLFRELILSAQKRIILEGQYYWSPQINDLLIYKALKMKSRDFEIILILTDLEKIDSLTRKMAHYQLSLIRELKKAAHHSKVRILAATPYVFPPYPVDCTQTPRPIYIHSKVIVIDDRYLSIGSANFATRAFRLDTEVNLTLEASNLSERTYIAQVAQAILDHWHQKPIHLLQPGKQKKPGRFRWELFFDPLVPLLFLRKRKLFGISTGDPRRAVILFFPVWILSSTLILWLGHLSLGKTTPGPAVYCFALSAIWSVPLPFMPLILILAWMKGSTLTSQITFYAIWIAGAVSYSFARLLPSTAAQFYAKEKNQSRLEQIEIRSFPALLRILLDPRISVHSKIVYQGLYFIPIAWLIFGTGIVLPALIYPWIRLGEWLHAGWGANLGFLIPFLDFLLPFYLFSWIGWELVKSGKNYGKAQAQPQRPILQYSQRVRTEQPTIQPQSDSPGDSARAPGPHLPTRGSRRT